MEQELSTKKHIGFRTKVAMSLTSFMAMSCMVLTYASAAGSNSPADALTKAGISSKSIDGDANSLFSSLEKVVYLVMAVGGFWGVFWIVIGGMLLSSSNGNPQKRSSGFGALALAAVGIFVIYKAYDIAGYAVNLGK